jgi:hypothetical protein
MTALVVARAEYRAAVSSRLVQGFGGTFALLALAIAIAGLAASGQLVVQGFTRTAVSLLSLALYLLTTSTRSPTRAPSSPTRRACRFRCAC